MSWVIARRRCPSGGAGFQAGGEWCEQQQLGLELIRIVRPSQTGNDAPRGDGGGYLPCVVAPRLHRGSFSYPVGVQEPALSRGRWRPRLLTR